MQSMEASRPSKQKTELHVIAQQLRNIEPRGNVWIYFQTRYIHVRHTRRWRRINTTVGRV